MLQHLAQPCTHDPYATHPACLVNIGIVDVVCCAGARLSVSLSASSVNAAATVAERAAPAAPIDTSKKPKELGFTMPGGLLGRLTAVHLLGEVPTAERVQEFTGCLVVSVCGMHGGDCPALMSLNPPRHRRCCSMARCIFPYGRCFSALPSPDTLCARQGAISAVCHPKRALMCPAACPSCPLHGLIGDVRAGAAPHDKAASRWLSCIP